MDGWMMLHPFGGREPSFSLAQSASRSHHGVGGGLAVENLDHVDSLFVRLVADADHVDGLVQDGRVRGLGWRGSTSLFGGSWVLGSIGRLFGLLTGLGCGGWVGHTTVVEGVGNGGLVLALVRCSLTFGNWCCLRGCSGSGGVLGSSSFILGLLAGLVGGVEVLEIESELQRDEVVTRGALVLDHGVLGAAAGLVGAGELGVFGDVATFRGSILVPFDDGGVVLANSLVGLFIEFDLGKLGLGLELGNQVVHSLALAGGEEDVIAVDLAHVGHEPLWVVAAQVDGHVNLLLKVVLELAGPWLLETSSGVLLEKGALGHLLL